MLNLGHGRNGDGERILVVSGLTTITVVGESRMEAPTVVLTSSTVGAVAVASVDEARSGMVVAPKVEGRNVAAGG